MRNFANRPLYCVNCTQIYSVFLLKVLNPTQILTNVQQHVNLSIFLRIIQCKRCVSTQSFLQLTTVTSIDIGKQISYYVMYVVR